MKTRLYDLNGTKVAVIPSDFVALLEWADEEEVEITLERSGIRPWRVILNEAKK